MIIIVMILIRLIMFPKKEHSFCSFKSNDIIIIVLSDSPNHYAIIH